LKDFIEMDSYDIGPFPCIFPKSDMNLTVAARPDILFHWLSIFVAKI